MFQGLEHTAISSPNPQKLAEWYVEHLGFHINFTYAGNYFVKAPNGTMLEIIPADRPLAAPQTPANNKDGGIRHLAIASDDFDAAHALLKEKGVTFVGEPFETRATGWCSSTICDGNLLHLIQREKPLP